MKCRGCGHILQHEFIDLGAAPPSNSFLTQKQLKDPEKKYPLKLFVCERCFLVQIDEYKKSSEIFDRDYVYFSSYSNSWLAHAKRYVEMITGRLGLNEKSLVVELASNDGYLLQYFKDVPVLGVEPSGSVARAAQKKGIETIVDFFGTTLAKAMVERGQKADLILGNNVLAHVPDINDFVAGMKMALKDQGTITAEFPHLMELIENNQFDTIYQEHYSYFSFHTILRILDRRRLKIYDVETLPTHGGSLRIYAGHAQDQTKSPSQNVTRLLEREQDAGMLDLKYYQDFSRKVKAVESALMDFLRQQRAAGKKIAGYGAAAKGNTLLNYCGIQKDMIDFVVDSSEHKQGKFLPGSHIPVVAENKLNEERPNFILILPWNLRDEITEKLSYVRQWGGQFVVPIPALEVF